VEILSSNELYRSSDCGKMIKVSALLEMFLIEKFQTLIEYIQQFSKLCSSSNSGIRQFSKFSNSVVQQFSSSANFSGSAIQTLVS